MNTTQRVHFDSKNSNVIGNMEIERKYLCRSEQETAVLTLHGNGIIRNCNQAAAELFDCAPSQLASQHVSVVMPQLTESTLIQDGKLNPNLRFLSRIGYGFEVIGLNGVHFNCALFFNEVGDFGQHCLRLIIRPMTQNLTVS